MKKNRNTKAPAIKTGLKVGPMFAAAKSEGSMKVLALECWRINKLIPEFEGNRKLLVLKTSVDKMSDALAALGVAIDDPEGSEFKEGMTLHVALFDPSDQLEMGRRMVSETLSPNIYIHDKLTNAARVIVTVGRKESINGA